MAGLCGFCHLNLGPHAQRASTLLSDLLSPSFSFLLQLCLGAHAVLTFKSLSLTRHGGVCFQSQALEGRERCRGQPGLHRGFQANRPELYMEILSQ